MSKSIFPQLLVSILLLLPAISTAIDIEPGVSYRLARQRHAMVSNVSYNIDLAFDSPSRNVHDGKIKITFDYIPDSLPLLIDFTGKAISGLKVNERQLETDWHDDHIIVPSVFLRQGVNSVSADFSPAERALNINPEYMYSLFVPFRAHSVFPCFDQPDIKACYNLTLTVPAGWKAVSNSPIVSTSDNADDGNTTITFGSTEPLSTYLFAFAVGKFDYQQYTHDDITIGAYYRETDPDRLAQLGDIFSQVESSLRQLEDYTGIPYPFAKYDLIILPGFQFGGMEHTGATFYNDNTIFLGKSATGADSLKRAELIAHETAHMWFGDYVTMEWFNDVWTKEVFANFFAAQLTRRLLPEFDHDLEWLRVYMSSALDQDRSDGSTPIRQDLDNMNNAGLIYNNIIYNKSPIVMGKLAEITGEENFRLGIRRYLNDHPYGNATWDDLVDALATFSDADIHNFSRVWIYEAGMPQILFKAHDDTLIARQIDPRGRGIVWPQTFDVVVSDGNDTDTLTVKFDGTTDTVEMPMSLKSTPRLIIPSADGRAYGLLTLDDDILKNVILDALDDNGIVSGLSPAGRLATLIMLNENYLASNFSTDTWLNFLINSIKKTEDQQMVTVLISYTSQALLDLTASEAAAYEQRLIALTKSIPSTQGHTLLLKSLVSVARSTQSIGFFYNLWKNGSSSQLSNDDFNDIALQLAISMPDEADSIITTQRSRIIDTDRLRRFDFLSRAAASDTVALDNLFESLREPDNRLVEPWTLTLLSLLNHPTRHAHSAKYIRPALEMLPELQATGDIFFPGNWASALLSSYRSKEASLLVRNFLEDYSDMNPLLLNKVKQAFARLAAKQR